MEIKVIGGGLAGAESAYQIAKRGQQVCLYEMRPQKFTPAHKTDLLSELVCSNSLKSMDLSNAHGLLKEELRRLDSLVMRAAEGAHIPGGKALVVDREQFSRTITGEIEAHPLIRVVREEIKEIPEGVVVIATGPLTSENMVDRIKEITGMENLHFFDAISPIIDGDSVDMGKAFFASRYADQQGDYLNCPFSEEEYNAFLDALISAERVAMRDFESLRYFEGCLPVEVMAERGRKTLAYGPMKPVGLTHPATGRRPYAVLQLRREDAAGTMYNMVGFQTKLTYPEQERVFRLIPGLEHAVFLRHGSVHRNTYINAPSVLTSRLSLASMERVFFAGQITGVEGYMESTAMGLLAGISSYRYAKGLPFGPPPADCCVGALLQYITTKREDFQPMNVNFGIVQNYNKKEKDRVVKQALESVNSWKSADEEDGNCRNGGGYEFQN